jgi:DNA-binding MarR family transcriptional regulator
MSISLYEFADELNKIMPTIIKEFARRHANELYKGKITLPQFFILNYLHENGESKMTDLAHFVKVTSAAMTGVIDRLVKYKYVLRVSDPKDRRIIKIKLTVKGEEFIKKINQQRRSMVINIFGKISVAERDEYLKILTRIRDILTKEAQE